MALEPGKNSSELKLFKQVMIAGVIIAIVASFGKVPFTPDQVGAYLKGVMTEAGDWAKVLAPYVAGLSAFYGSLRTYLKQKELGNEAAS